MSDDTRPTSGAPVGTDAITAMSARHSRIRSAGGTSSSSARLLLLPSSASAPCSSPVASGDVMASPRRGPERVFK